MPLTLDETYELHHPAASVWAGLNDIQFVASCFPGATLETRRDDGDYDGSIAMKLGPTKVRFRGTLAVSFDEPSMTATLRARGDDARRTRAAATATVRVQTAAGPAATRLRIDASVDVVGPLSQFARGGGTEMTRILLQDFAAAVDTRLGKQAPDERESPPEHSPPSPPPSEPAASAPAPSDPAPSDPAPSDPAPIRSGQLLIRMLAAAVRRLAGRIRGRGTPV